jgi:hypothetical protein
MSVKEGTQSVGIFLLATGFLCMPIALAWHVTPARYTSLFNVLAAMGAFWKAGLYIMGIGGIALLISCFLPARFKSPK